MSINNLKSVEENKEMLIESGKKFNIEKFVDKKLPVSYGNNLVNQKFEINTIYLFINQLISGNNFSFKEFMNNLEREILVKTLSRFNGNQRRTSKYLGMKYTTLNQKVKKHNIHFSKKIVDEAS